MDLKIGKHCSLSLCKQLDFLPFTCRGCNKVFCAEHRKPSDHGCTVSFDNCPACHVKRVVNECPLCHQIIPYKAGVDPNDLMVAHMDAGCPKEHQIKSEHRYPCRLKGCKVEELAPIPCEHCRLNHCVQHRHPDKHDCKKWSPDRSESKSPAPAAPTMSNPLQEAWKILQSRISNLRSSNGSKSKPGLNSKNKSAAIGNKKILEQDRIYLEVVYPADSGIETKWMFFEAKHPAGRALDSIADEGKINNNNNVSTARKLALVDITTGTAIKLHTPLKSLFANGSTILLEYEDVINVNAPLSSATSSSSPVAVKVS